MRRKKENLTPIEGRSPLYRGLYNSRLVGIAITTVTTSSGGSFLAVGRDEEQSSSFSIPLCCAVCVYVYYPVVKVERYGFCSAYLDDNRDETIPHCVQAASSQYYSSPVYTHTHTMYSVSRIDLDDHHQSHHQLKKREKGGDGAMLCMLKKG